MGQRGKRVKKQKPLKGCMLVYVLMVSFHFDIIIEKHKFNL